MWSNLSCILCNQFVLHYPSSQVETFLLFVLNDIAPFLSFATVPFKELRRVAFERTKICTVQRFLYKNLALAVR